jgi:hypothetical protein
MTESRKVPGLNSSVMHPARRYNYWLGGKDNFEVDRASGDAVAKAFPAIRPAARANRRFLGDAVRFLAGEAGIRQFLDVGTGLPTEANTHEVVQTVAPASRIAYVDNDPLVLVHARALLTSSQEGRTTYIDADARTPEAILRSPDLEILDLQQPVAVLLVAVLHFIPHDEVAQHTVRTLMSAMPAGSYLVISHAAAGLLQPGEEKRVRAAFQGEDFKLRTRQTIATLGAGLEIVDPGIVPVQRWRPSPGDELPADHELGMYAFVARKQADGPIRPWQRRPPALSRR